MIDSLPLLHADMRACHLCLEAGYSIVPGAVFSSHAESKLLLIGQAPGITEGVVKRPFNASSGRRLFQWLGQAGWDEERFRARQAMTAVTKCYPGKNDNGKGDRVPSKEEQALCRPFLERELRLIQPQVIVLVGGLAIKQLFPKQLRLDQIIGTAVYFAPEVATDPCHLNWDDGILLGLAELQNQIDQLAADGRFVVPLPHPSGASLWLNKPANQALIAQAIQVLYTLRQARPWLA